MFFTQAVTEVSATAESGSQLNWDGILAWVQAYGIKALEALVIFFVGRWIAGVISRLAGKTLTRTKITPTLNAFLVRVIHILLVVVVVVTALGTLGVPTTSLVAIIGAASLAIGLALQSSLSNFAAGILIVLLRPFQINDFIEAGSVSGTVEEIGIFTTQLRTSDNRVIIVPNSSLTSQSIVNVSIKPTRRIDLVIGISYNDNIKTAKEIIQRVLGADSRILSEPVSTIAVSNLGESSVDIIVRPWVKASDYWPTRFHLIETIKMELEAGGCSIPYPQRDVHVFQETGK